MIVVLPAHLADTPEHFDLAVVAQRAALQMIYPAARIGTVTTADGDSPTVDGIPVTGWITFVTGDDRLAVALNDPTATTGFGADPATVDDAMRTAIVTAIADTYGVPADLLTVDDRP